MCVRCGEEEVNENGEESAKYFCDECQYTLEKQLDFMIEYGDCCIGMLPEFVNIVNADEDSSEWYWKRCKWSPGFKTICFFKPQPSDCLIRWSKQNIRCNCCEEWTYNTIGDKGYVLMAVNKLIKNANFTC